MNFIFTAAFALGAIALIAAAILYACSTKFAVRRIHAYRRCLICYLEQTVEDADTQAAQEWQMHL